MNTFYNSFGFTVFWCAAFVITLIAGLTALSLWLERTRIRWPFARLKAWRERRYWQKRHMDFVRRMVHQDWRWLSDHLIADAITARYIAALSSDWYQRQHEPVNEFRSRLRKLNGSFVPNDAQVAVALAAMHLHDTPQSRKDMRKALMAANGVTK